NGASRDPFVQTEWTRLLSYNILFYEAQRSGILPANNRIGWRHDSALDDGHDNGTDLVGGYYDAGDYLKFTLPLSFSLSQLAWGGIAFWRTYEESGQAPAFDLQLRWGLDWLMKAHANTTTIYAQVGDGTLDHNYWGPDTGIPRPRPAYSIDAHRPGTDLAASVCAAFASGAILYRRHINDAAYADLLQQHAMETCEFAESRPMRLYQDSVPSVAPYYASSGYYDDLCWAMVWMARLTGEQAYLERAKQYIYEGRLRASKPPFNWDEKRGGCFVVGAIARSRMGEGGTDQDWKDWAESYLDSIVTLQNAQLTAGGLLWYHDLSDSDSTVFASNAAQLLLTYAARNLPVNSARRRRYENFATAQFDYLLGRNPVRIPYVIGVHPNSPKNPHHAGTHGGTDLQNLDDPPESQHILYGAVVGGPSFLDEYEDQRDNWKQSEVTLDYNAGFQSVVAHQYLYATDAPYYAGLPE
ncbi:Six-hairpin glycosidase-like protein, partial [Syncephalis pseudoplumigaleata]